MNGYGKHQSFLRRLGGWFDYHLGALFLLPGITVLGAVIACPILANLWLSLTDAHLIYPGYTVIWWENFELLLTNARFWGAFWNTILWTVGSVSLQCIIGGAAALLLNRPIKGQTLFRLLLIVPYTFPPITVALSWRWMFNGVFGVFNAVLMQLGVLDTPIPWLGNAQTALFTAMIVNVWFGFPLFTLAIFAGLQAIPKEYYEVAAIEGASGWQTLWKVILPSLRTIIGIMLVLRTIWVFNGFDILFLLTGGGPGRSTETLPIFIYVTGWGFHMLGESAAVAVLLFIVLGGLAFAYFRLLRIEEVT